MSPPPTRRRARPAAGRPTAPAQATDGQAYAARAESVELALVQAYDALVDLVGEDLVPVLETNRAHHRDHAEGFAALAGSAATGEPDRALVEGLAPRLEALSGQGAALAFARDLEERMAATHAHGVTLVDDRNIAQEVAAVLAVEAAHAAALGIVLGDGTLDWFPDGAFETTDPARGLDPAAVPPG